MTTIYSPDDASWTILMLGLIGICCLPCLHLVLIFANQHVVLLCPPCCCMCFVMAMMIIYLIYFIIHVTVWVVIGLSLNFSLRWWEFDLSAQINAHHLLVFFLFMVDICS